jgi:hypothetical protein
MRPCGLERPLLGNPLPSRNGRKWRQAACDEDAGASKTGRTAPICRAARWSPRKESRMTTESRPEPAATETPAPSDKDGETQAVITTHPNLEREEDEAARLGDFA